MEKPVVDYRKFRLNKLGTDEFCHLKLLIYWAVFGIMFIFVERVRVVDRYYVMHCGIDDVIPFCEYFLIPYLFWFVFIIGMLAYTLLYDIPAFRRMMYFIMTTYTIAIFVYLIFPNCQQLRPAEFVRDNIFTRFMRHFYEFDTNTNVCPSIHVIGSAAVCFTAMSIERFKTPGWSVFFTVATFLICVSTMFLKQHSFIDVAAALPVCAVGYVVSFKKRKASAARETADSGTA